MSSFDYDLFVIGAGSGGVRAARIAAGYGAKVAIAEEYRVGGTCVIRGCVPKKLMVYASHIAHEIEDGARFGWTAGKPTFDWAILRDNVAAEVDRLNGLYIQNLEKAGVEIFSSRAEFVGDHEVRLTGLERIVTAKCILIATGGAPFIDPTLPGSEYAITSNEVFSLPTFPKKIVIAGGGYIAVEFAGIFQGLGAETTLVYRGDQVLRGFDDDLRSQLSDEIRHAGIDLRTHTNIERLDRKGDQVDVTLVGGEVISADAALFAIGRRPATAGLGLETVGVAVDARSGAIKVDAQSMTSRDHIFAVGDVTDRVNLTPVAIREGHAFADTVFGGKPVTVDHSLIPTAVFSAPELGTVGLTEADARAGYPDLDIYRTTFRPMKATISGRADKIFMKLLVDAGNDKVLGVHMMGHGAGELIQVLGIALKMGATKADFDATIAVHPTAAEEFVTLRTPAETVRNGVTC